MSDEILRVSIVYHYVAHYREPVFTALLNEGPKTGIRYTIAADTSSEAHAPSIKVIDHEAFSRKFPGSWVRLENVWLGKNVLWQRGLLGHVWRERPHAVIFLGDIHFISVWAGAVLARLLGAKAFMWTHGMLREERGITAAIRLGFYRLAHHLLVYGHRAKGLLESRGYPAHRVHVIYNSLDHDTQLSVRAELLRRSQMDVRTEVLGDPSGKVLVFSGRLERFKGLDLLLRALALIPGASKIRLICIGDGPERSQLQRVVADLGLENRVVFWGSCYDETTLGKLFYAADLTVSPGRLGLLAVHSLTYGTPVLFGDDPDTHAPEFEAVTPGVTGAVFRDGSAESLASSIVHSLEHLPKPSVSDACFRAIDTRYNPHVQAAIINGALAAACR